MVDAAAVQQQNELQQQQASKAGSLETLSSNKTSMSNNWLSIVGLMSILIIHLSLNEPYKCSSSIKEPCSWLIFGEKQSQNAHIQVYAARFLSILHPNLPQITQLYKYHYYPLDGY